jgi:3-hydroxy-9,10-secoandrosta-1,3,5(10)-triene-9,17-dione monooxygenase
MTAATLDAIRELLPRLRERAVAAEKERRVPAASIDELREAGMFRMLQPAHAGGLESDPREFFEAGRLVATACGSTGWVASVLGVHPWQIALFDAEAQKEVWDADPDTLVSSSYAPTGTIGVVDGGYTISGRWQFSSGSDHATWVLLGGVVFGADGAPVDFGTFLVPRTDYRVDDVWNTIGLRGTGSNDIVIDGAFVPAHRMLSFVATTALDCPGHAVNAGAMYRLPFASVFSNSITAPIIGMAQGAYAAHVELTRERIRISYGGQKVAQDAFAQVRVAEAASDLDASWLQLTRNIGELMDLAEAGAPIPLELRVRVRRDQVLGTVRAIHAVDRLFENSGGHALQYGNPVERAWRDAHAGRVHPVNDPERALSMYGMAEMGLDVHEPMI